MTRLAGLFFASAVVAAAAVSPALAHSGRTDSSGGHYCRTNCERYGYEYGSYHLHSPKKARESGRREAR